MTTVDRRRFMQGTAAAFLCALCPRIAFAQSTDSTPGPFQLAAELQALADSSGRPLLDAGTGSPNFLHVAARRAHSQLLQSALALTGSSGLRPERSDLGARLLETVRGLPADTSLAQVILDQAHEVSGLEADEVADQLLQMLLGSTYAGFQTLARSAALSYQRQELGLVNDDWLFFCTSGASEALSLIFQRFKSDGVLGPGKKIVEIVPTFSPFSVWPSLKGDFEVDSISLEPREWTLTEKSLRKLVDPAVKVVYLVDPGNPVPTALDRDSVERLVRVVKEGRDDLIILADSVYGCFPEVWHPVISALPENTIGIGSWSKHFGATGWRLGCLLVHPRCVLRDKLTVPLEKFVKPQPVTLPQQGMLTVFSLAQLTPWGRKYDEHLRELLSERWGALYDGLGSPMPRSGRYSKFFAAVSLDEVAKSNGLRPWPKIRELDFLRQLASSHGAICLPCSGFSGPRGMLRISLASLSVEQSRRIGRSVVKVLKDASGLETP
jgi:aspartate 4-decarboxylase